MKCITPTGIETMKVRGITPTQDAEYCFIRDSLQSSLPLREMVKQKYGKCPKRLHIDQLKTAIEEIEITSEEPVTYTDLF